MNNILGNLDFVAVYIDDMCLSSASKTQDLQHLKINFDRLRQAKLRINLANISGTFYHGVWHSPNGRTTERKGVCALEIRLGQGNTVGASDSQYMGKQF